MLQENPEQAADMRPSKVRAMLAMRACRGSIMIGRGLDKPQMVRILTHLAGLKSPWNCPHGRPTMRHLADLSRVKIVTPEPLDD
jgi:DNA mismatch repair protein PMS2